MKKFTYDKLNQLVNIISRKKEGINCTEAESVLIKEYIKTNTTEHRQSDAGLAFYKVIIKRFPQEYQEAIDEFERESTFTINDKTYRGTEHTARQKYLEEYGANYENAGMVSDDQIPSFENWAEETLEEVYLTKNEVIHLLELCDRIAEKLKLSPTNVVEEIAKMVMEDSEVKYLGDSMFELKPGNSF